MNYDFVKDIVTRTISTRLLHQLRKQAIPGSHADIILKESLYDREYDLPKLGDELSQHKDAVFMTSFPNEAYADTHLLFRSEFLYLAYCGNSYFDYTQDRPRYLQFIADYVERIKPRSLIYRLCDYNVEDFSFFRTGSDSLLSRGAQRLIDDQRLFDMDMQALATIASKNIPIKLLIPCIQFPEQLEMLLQRIEVACKHYDIVIEEIGMMLELPVNLHQVASYANVDFYIFGPGDLLKFYYGGIDRNDNNFSKVNNSIILSAVRSCLDDINALGQRKAVYFAKSLIEHSDELRASHYTNIDFINLYLPSQLMHRHAIAEQADTITNTSKAFAQESLIHVAV